MSDFYKYHGLGNEYIIIDPNKSKFLINKKNIELICDRNYGIGSNGVLLGPIIKNNKIAFKIFNTNGSEAEKSGNGIRIFAQYIYEHGYVKTKQFSLYTKKGKILIQIIEPLQNIIKSNIGEYSFLSDKIAINISFKQILNQEIKLLNKKKISFVSIGNPHCVIIKHNISKEQVKKLGPMIEKHQLLLKKSNIQFVQILDKSNIKIEIWERGVGYTLASGTGSASASCVAHKLNFIEDSISINMKGGNVNIKININKLFLTGNIIKVFNGMFRAEFIKKVLNN